jgi:hypothetical protein
MCRIFPLGDTKFSLDFGVRLRFRFNRRDAAFSAPFLRLWTKVIEKAESEARERGWPPFAIGARGSRDADEVM